MKAKLNIPFSEKDTAKEIAKKNKCVLYFADPVNKLWEFSGDKIPSELKKYVVEEVVEPSANKKSATSATNKKTQIKPIQSNNLYSDRYQYILDIPFAQRDQFGSMGVYWNGEHKAYITQSNALKKELLPFSSQPYSYEAWIERQINKGKIRQEITEQLAVENFITPRKYQKEAEAITLKVVDSNYGGFLLADEVGLGKTISAALVAQDKRFKTILVVTTLSAVAHWRKTFLKMIFKDKNILMINYDRLQKLFKADEKKYKTKAKSKKSKNKRLANTGVAPKFDLIIWDESHKMKNNTSMRAKLGMKLAQNANFNLYLSATAGQNPLELSYLAPLLAKITGHSVASMNDFEKWCQTMDFGVKRVEYGKWVWDGDQKSIDKVHKLLFKGKPQAALRRSPKDIAGYPEISRALTPLELPVDDMESYKLAWNEFKAALYNLKTKKTRPQKGDDNALVIQLRLRQKASFLKIPYTLENIENLLDNGHQVAVSIGFKEPMFEIQSKLAKMGINCALIHGGQNATEKESQRLKFQKGEVKVVLFTVEEAISLHQGEYNDAPRSMLIHDLRWSAISMSQIEGRTHRDGKFSQIYWLYFTNTIEEQIAQVVLNRVISMKGMVGDDTTVLKEIEALLLKSIAKDDDE